MEYQLLPKLASMREIQRHYRQLFSSVRKNKEALYLFSQSEPEVVVLDVNVYEHLVKSLQKSEELRLQDVIKTGDTEYRTGKTKTGNLSNLL